MMDLSTNQRLIKARPLKFLDIEIVKEHSDIYRAMLNYRVSLEYEVSVTTKFGDLHPETEGRALEHIAFCDKNCEGFWTHIVKLDDNPVFEKYDLIAGLSERRAKINANVEVMFYMAADYEKFLQDFAVLKRLEA